MDKGIFARIRFIWCVKTNYLFVGFGDIFFDFHAWHIWQKNSLCEELVDNQEHFPTNSKYVDSPYVARISNDILNRLAPQYRLYLHGSRHLDWSHWVINNLQFTGDFDRQMHNESRASISPDLNGPPSFDNELTLLRGLAAGSQFMGPCAPKADFLVQGQNVCSTSTSMKINLATRVQLDQMQAASRLEALSPLHRDSVHSEQRLGIPRANAARPVAGFYTGPAISYHPSPPKDCSAIPVAASGSPALRTSPASRATTAPERHLAGGLIPPLQLEHPARARQLPVLPPLDLQLLPPLPASQRRPVHPSPPIVVPGSYPGSGEGSHGCGPTLSALLCGGSTDDSEFPGQVRVSSLYTFPGCSSFVNHEAEHRAE